MSLSLQSSFLFILGTIIIAVALSFLSKDTVCASLASQLETLDSSSIQALLIHTLHQHFCGQASQQDNKQDDWNMFYHLGGNGPWIEKSDARFGTYEKDGKPPPGCVIDQVHMLARHAERHPTKNVGARHVSLLSRLKPYHLNDSLSFLNNNNWTYFTPQPPESAMPSFEDLTTTSMYAGTLSAFTLGTTFRTRYWHLLPSASKPNSRPKAVNFWSASSPRDIETALYFADGLFGRNWSHSNAPNLGSTAKLHIIPESPHLGSNTLTPGTTCLNYITNDTHGRPLGYRKLDEWQNVFTADIIRRFEAENPELDPPLSPGEVYSMMEMCGFEMLVRGSGSGSGSGVSGAGGSPWCTIFTRSEWESFEYARDLLHYYRAGPGNEFSRVMGAVWLDATSQLLVEPSALPQAASGSGSGEVYVSFVHDGDLIPVLTALGGFNEEDGLPSDRVKRDRNWRTSTLAPMAARLVIERLNCRTPHGWRWRDIRVWVNDGNVGFAVHPDGEERKTVIFIPQMEVSRFNDVIKRKVREYGSFSEVCGLQPLTGGKEEEGIMFLHQ